MGKVLSSGGGGGTIFSSDLTSIAGHVLKGDSYVGNDTNDDQGVGTMPDIAAVDEGISVAQSGGKLLCRMHNGAHIKDAESGYPEVSYDLATVRKAINYTDTSKVLTGTSIAGANGTMKNLSDSPNTKYQSDDSTPVLVGDAGFWSTNADGKARLQIRYNGTQGFIKPNTLIGVEKDVLKDAVINAYGIGSVINFKISQYNTKTILCSWDKPTDGKMWSGVVVRTKQGSYPSDINDGIEITNGTNDTSVIKVLDVGTWYFRYWNYVTVSNADGERWYDEGNDGGSFNNQQISGSRNFTGSTSYVVPVGVRTITAFCVGGGGGVTNPYLSDYQVGMSSGAAGGYTRTASFAVTPGETLSIVVGGGGNGDAGGCGGTSGIYRGGSALIAAGGGGNANWATGGNQNDGCGMPSGANGGSGGGSSCSVPNGVTRDSDGIGGAGGSDGGNGGGSYYYYYNNRTGNRVNSSPTPGGSGQGYSTRAWGNVGQPYSPGGGGIGMGKYWGSYGSSGSRAGHGSGLTGANSGAASFSGWSKDKYQSASGNVWQANSRRSYGSSGIVMIKWG